MSTGKHWVTEPHQILEPKVLSSGYGSRPPTTVIEVFTNVVAKHGGEKAMAKKHVVDGKVAADWTFWTWKEYYDDCRKFAKTLLKLKISPFEIINVLGFNSPEWFIANTGAIMAGCIAAGIYTSNLPDACHYISDHSKAPVIVVEGNKQLLKYTKVSGPLPHLKAIVVWDEVVDKTIAAKCSCPVYSFEEFMNLGSDVTDAEVDNRTVNVKPGNCVTLIYTSGTTGPPKAVMISNDNITWTAQNIVENYMDLNHTDRVISYLPLSHIAAQIIDIHCMMAIGGCAYFAQPDALKGTLTITMKEMRPTFFFGVPRVWEKIQEKMVQIGRSTVGIKKTLSNWAKSCGTEHIRRMQFGNGGGTGWGYGCANSLVLSKIKEALGLDQCKGAFTAAAPIAPETLHYFGSLDIPVFEAFGQSECTGPHSFSFVNKWKIGYCGRPMKGTETMIVPGNGELCYRGRHIFMGYMYMPEKTAETIDDEGYLHSGDVAEIDDNNDPEIPAPSGFLRITGRIKELIITAGGENIPPVLIENEMKAAMVALSNVMVIGDKRKFLSMVVSLKVEMDAETGLPKDKLATDSVFVGQQIGSTATTYKEAMADPLWAKYVTDGMKKANGKTTSNAQNVQKWKWLPKDFSEKEGDLTPTLKLKRNVVTEKYGALIESIYEGGDEA